MKKVLLALVVLLFAVSVYAESRLDLSGQMRIRGKSFENLSNFNDDDDSDKENYFDQRLRIAGKINVAEGISVHFRLDFDEEKWGTQGSHGTSEIQTDRAFLEIDKDMYRLRAGRQLFGLGNYMALDHNGVGFLATLKTPVSVTFGYIKADEGSDAVNNLSDDSDYGSEDINVYVLNLGYKYNKAFNINAFVGYEDGGDYTVDEAAFDDNGDIRDDLGFFDNDGDVDFGDYAHGEYDRMVIGLQADGTIANFFNYNIEYNNFSGEVDDYYDYSNDAAVEDKDYVGNQFYGDLNVNINMFKVGTEVFYAMGTDEEDEIQTTALAEEKGLWDDFVPMGNFGDSDILDYAFASDYTSQGVFELSENAGSMGIVPYVSVSPIDKLSLMLNVGYFEPEEDSVTNLDSVVVAVLSADYKLYENVGILAQYAYVAPDTDNPDGDELQTFQNDDPANAFYGKLYVNF